MANINEKTKDKIGSQVRAEFDKEKEEITSDLKGKNSKKIKPDFSNRLDKNRDNLSDKKVEKPSLNSANLKNINPVNKNAEDLSDRLNREMQESRLEKENSARLNSTKKNVISRDKFSPNLSFSDRKKEAVEGRVDSSSSENISGEGPGTDVERERAVEARLNFQKKQDNNVQNLKIEKKPEEKINNFRLGLDKALQKMMTEFVVPSFSLSLFYVYIHVLLSQLFPKYFCKLGHEWVPDNIKRTDSELAKKMGDKIGIAEKPAVGCACGCHLFLIIIVIAIIYFIINWDIVAWNWLKDVFSGS